LSIFLRNSRVAFKITGPEAAKLLNDVLSTTIRQEDKAARWWALLTPQGKIVAEGLLGWQDGAFWLDAGADFAADFFKRMRMYRLRANVEISDLSASHVVGWSEQPVKSPDLITHQDIRAGGLGYRVIAPIGAGQDWHNDETAFAAKRIGMGIGEMGPDFASETMFPHDIGMDLLGGIDFKKGCYVGQEVVSRMQHRGAARRRPLIVSDIKTGNGKSVVAGEREVGVLGQVVNGVAVGFLRLDRINAPEQARVGNQPVTLAVPEWASYGFYDSDDE